MEGSWLGPTSAFLSSVTWALGTAAYGRLIRRYSGYAINTSRALVALPLFALTVLAAGVWTDWGKLDGGRLGWLVVSMIASYGLGDVFFFWSTRTLGVPGALAIASTYPIWTALGGWALGEAPLSGLQWAGLLLVVGGMGLVILYGPQEVFESGGPIPRFAGRRSVGLGLAFAASLLWALNNVAIDQGGTGLSTPAVNTVRMLLALGICPLMAAWLMPGTPRALPFTVLRRYFWVMALEAYGGATFFVYGLVHAPLAVAATLSSLSPVLAVPIAWIMGLERPSWGRTFGVAAVAAGLGLLLSA
ncbi:MAG: DMT family transporter [Bacteroidota bacterium]|nr:DMT family transporter [Bacteroidota bacterium]MDW8138447.1 DMT family transporter [Bacteroidota bacterium]